MSGSTKEMEGQICWFSERVFKCQTCPDSLFQITTTRFFQRNEQLCDRDAHLQLVWIEGRVKELVRINDRKIRDHWHKRKAVSPMSVPC